HEAAAVTSAMCSRFRLISDRLRTPRTVVTSPTAVYGSITVASSPVAAACSLCPAAGGSIPGPVAASPRRVHRSFTPRPLALEVRDHRGEQGEVADGQRGGRTNANGRGGARRRRCEGLRQG